MSAAALAAAVLATAAAGTARTASPDPALANWTRAADFTLTPAVLSKRPGPFSATIADACANTLFRSGAFEPLMLRRRFIAENGTAGDTVVVSANKLSEYDSWVDGWLDRSNVTVYRLSNGKFTSVRTTTVAATRCSGWNGANSVGGGQLVSTAEAADQVPSWFQPNTTLWYSVQAVDRNGNASAPSVAVRVGNVPLPPGHGGQPPSNSLVPRPKLDTNHPNATVPPTPTGLVAEVDHAAAVVRLRWDAVRWPSLAGYAVSVAYAAPEDLKGYALELFPGGGEPLMPGDMLFLSRRDHTFNRSTMSPRIWNAQGGSNPSMLGFQVGQSRWAERAAYNGEGDGIEWTLVPHPPPVPAELASQAGATCVRVQTDSAINQQVTLGSGGVSASTTQSYYAVLDPTLTYVVEIWARADTSGWPGSRGGPLPVALEFGPSPNPAAKKTGHPNLVDEVLNVTGQWQRFSFSFKTPWEYNTSGTVQSATLSWAAPGAVLYLDNWRMYQQDAPFMGVIRQDVDALQASGLGYIRTHAFIKSTYGYDMDSLTGAPGVTQTQFNGGPKTMHTLASMLGVMRDAGANPWLQVEQYMSDDELLGLAEYLAAPYDPSKDTPESKPWAAKRHSQGQAAPYTDEFSSFLYEISNEEWNGMFYWGFSFGTCVLDHGTGEAVCDGSLLGLWQEKTVAVLRSSPYWTPSVDAKFRFVIGGWAVQDGGPNSWHSGYGTLAAVNSPSSAVVNIAGYNGGWDAGEAATIPNNQGFFKALSFTEQNADPVSSLMEAVRANLSVFNKTHVFDGTYEAGPGYNMNGLNGVKMNASQVEAESRVMKSLAAGTATLDSFLTRANHGFVVQNFFTFSRNRYYWTSHAPLTSGGQAYPSWKALSLYNVNGTGDFLRVEANSVPTANLPGSKRRPNVTDAPVVAAYATRDGGTTNVFVLSRKLDSYPFAGDDGFTQVTLHLPFKLGASGRITRYRLAGDPRANNLDTDSVRIEIDVVPTSAFQPDFRLDASTGADARGLAPASTYMYAFDGAEW